MNAIFRRGRMPGFEQVTIFKLFAKKFMMMYIIKINIK